MIATLHRRGKPPVTGEVIFACPTGVVMMIAGRERSFGADFRHDRLEWKR